MAVDTKHLEYQKYAPKWAILRDIVEGEDAIHNAGEKYLPKISSQSAVDYELYKRRAPFYNATGKTVDAFTGLIFRKDPIVSVPEEMQEFLKDVAAAGISFGSFAESLIDELVTITRAGVLVDFPELQADPETGQLPELTIAQAEAAGLRPFWSLYKGEAIINWSKRKINNRMVLDRVVLWDPEYQRSAKDEFCMDQVPQYRVLELDDFGNYQQRLFHRSATGGWIQVKVIVPLMNGKPLSFIPFVFFGAKDGEPAVDKPILEDLGKINIHHYQNQASLEHGLFWVGLPTPVVTGTAPPLKGEDDSITLGPSQVLTIPDPQGQAFFMEMEGKGLDALSGEIEKKEGRMAAFGARLLQPEKAAAETAETTQMKRQGEYSVLASLAISASGGIERLFKITGQWMGIDDAKLAEWIRCKLNTDYLAAGMDAQTIQALLQAYQGSAISFDDFITALQRGEVIDASKTPEQIKEEIQADGAPLGSIGLGLGL